MTLVLVASEDPAKFEVFKISCELLNLCNEIVWCNRNRLRAFVAGTPPTVRSIVGLLFGSIIRQRLISNQPINQSIKQSNSATAAIDLTLITYKRFGPHS
jgi:hypothetical protein